jgi:hypothetical protein
MSDYSKRAAESFMDMAGKCDQRLREVESTLQYAIRLLERHITNPYTGDYETDENNANEVYDFIMQFKYVPDTPACKTYTGLG